MNNKNEKRMLIDTTKDKEEINKQKKKLVWNTTKRKQKRIKSYLQNQLL